MEPAEGSQGYAMLDAQDAQDLAETETSPLKDDGGPATTRRQINDLLDNPESGNAARGVHYFMIFLILGSTASTIIETMPEMRDNPMFFPLEMVITALFTVEFTLRLYACESIRNFVLNGFNIIDFLAIFPGYVELALPLIIQDSTIESEGDSSATAAHVHKAAGSMRTLRMIRIIRLVRVIRVMRLAKVARHSQALSIILAVLAKVSQSGLVVILMLMSFMMVLSASLIYLFESERCEEAGISCTGPAAFTSIPAAFWWSISTLTTVGYGDMVPHTIGGKFIASITAVIGVIIVAVGIALISINFRESYLEERARVKFRRQGASEDRKDRQEIEELMKAFDKSSNSLLKKLVAATRRHDEDQMMPMLTILQEHVLTLNKDINVFVKDILPDAHSRMPTQERQSRPSRSSGYHRSSSMPEQTESNDKGLNLPLMESGNGGAHQ